jgi:hypothetical protein
MEMNDSDDVQRLIRLKRYESPGDEYFQSFMDEFKERQRSEMLKQSARGLLFERITMWFEESGGARRFVPSGALAVATVGAGLYFATTGGGESTAPSLAGSAKKEASATSVLYFASPAVGEDQPIQLQLPARDNRVPGVSDDHLSAVPGILPAGVRGHLREL